MNDKCSQILLNLKSRRTIPHEWAPYVGMVYRANHGKL